MKKKRKEQKSMTIRYDDNQEKEIEDLMTILGEKTMSKAFLQCHRIIVEQMNEMESMSMIIEEQKKEINKLKEIVGAWDNFNHKLENFLR